MAVQGGAKAGKISKPYGLQGEVHIILNPSVAKHIEQGNPLFIDLDGQRVPFFIESADLVSDNQAIVGFEFITSVEEARKVCGHDVYLDPAKHFGSSGDPDGSEDPENLENRQKVVGYQAIDEKLGALGPVLEYLPNEMNPVWLIDYSGKELMIPAAEEFIKRINHRKQTLHLNLPEGLTDL
ncbi:MAG: hypothetical protein ABFS10_02280 [Bacteroidota bacterium]